MFLLWYNKPDNLFMSSKVQKFILSLLPIFILAFSSSPSHAEISPIINEFLAAPTDNKEWVELYNPDKVDIKTYWIDDDLSFSSDSGNSDKKQLTDSIVSSDGIYSYIELSSFLNNSGDWVVLFKDTGEEVDKYEYTSNPGENVSIGRPNNSGSFVALQSLTKGSSNSGAIPTPTSVPTATVTPTKTPTPTPTPEPTKVPTPTRTPTPTKTPIPTKSPTPKPISTQVVGGAEENAKPLKLDSNGDVLSSTDSAIFNMGSEEKNIMGVDLVPSPTSFDKPTAPLSVKGQSTSPQLVIMVALGVVFIGACGILLFRNYLKNKNA